MNIEKYIRIVQDFPKKGISYKDITPLLQNYSAVQECLSQFEKKLGEKKIDKVIGIESRGFFFATLLAQRLKAGFAPIRKAGKLPYLTEQESYSLEYGEDLLEIHQDALKKGEHVLLHDDVLATGGTAKAACNLIEKLGGEIIQCNFLIELSFLEGRKKLVDKEIVSLIEY